jgi:hypothetical protein
MSFERKWLVVALASVLPWASAQAQSAADLQKEISALRAQLQSLQQKVESLNTSPEPSAAIAQQVNRMELRADQASDDSEKSGFKGLKFSGTIEAALKYDDLKREHAFGSSAGNSDEFGVLQFTKESQDGEGVDWTLRLAPGATAPVHEASISVPLSKANRIIGGLIPDWQGYEFYFANANATLGNQLISHNALFDLTGATAYAGLGMSHSLDNGKYFVKWLVGNMDAKTSDTTPTLTTATSSSANASNTRSVGLAYRGDWFFNEYSYIGFSGLHGSVNRNFSVMAFDGGYTRGDWAFNGQLSFGSQRNAASNGDDAAWTGISAMAGYKMTPRLQLLARADMIENRKNGGGTYAYNAGSNDIGLGVEATDTGAPIDANVGANLTRVSLGTNYQINANTQWKFEYRFDQSTGYNFKDLDGVFTRTKKFIGTSMVLSF